MPESERRPIIVAALVACLISIPITAAQVGGPPDIERHVFIHVPRERPDNSAARGGGGPKPGGGTSTCPDPATCADYKWGGHKWPGAVS